MPRNKKACSQRTGFLHQCSGTEFLLRLFLLYFWLFRFGFLGFARYRRRDHGVHPFQNGRLGRVALALLEREQPNDALVEAVLNASTSIASDHELSTLLVKVAETYSLNDRLRTMYIDAAEGISSQYERDRALAALVRRGGIQ